MEKQDCYVTETTPLDDAPRRHPQASNAFGSQSISGNFGAKHYSLSVNHKKLKSCITFFKSYYVIARTLSESFFNKFKFLCCDMYSTTKARRNPARQKYKYLYQLESEFKMVRYIKISDYSNRKLQRFKVYKCKAVH